VKCWSLRAGPSLSARPEASVAMRGAAALTVLFVTGFPPRARAAHAPTGTTGRG